MDGGIKKRGCQKAALDKKIFQYEKKIKHSSINIAYYLYMFKHFR